MYIQRYAEIRVLELCWQISMDGCDFPDVSDEDVVCIYGVAILRIRYNVDRRYSSDIHLES